MLKLFAMLNLLAPKKFLCRYPLSLGATCGGITLIFITAICGLVLFVDVLTIKDCDVCSPYVWRNSYSFSITGVIYSIFMLCVHTWFLWGVRKEKASAVLCWVVVTGMWLAQTFVLLLILICMYRTQVKFVPWLLSFIFGLIAIFIILYIVLIGCGFWLELKKKQKSTNVNLNSTT